MPVPLSVPVSVRGRRADSKEPIEQGEGLLGSAPREGNVRRVRAGALLQPDGREDAHGPCDATPDPQPSGGAPERPAVEVRARVAQANVTANPADPPIPARADNLRGIRGETLAVGVAGPVIPAAQE
jgi:hypothetical protein